MVSNDVTAVTIRKGGDVEVSENEGGIRCRRRKREAKDCMFFYFGHLQTSIISLSHYYFS